MHAYVHACSCYRLVTRGATAQDRRRTLAMHSTLPEIAQHHAGRSGDRAPDAGLVCVLHAEELGTCAQG